MKRGSPVAATWGGISLVVGLPGGQGNSRDSRRAALAPATMVAPFASTNLPPAFRPSSTSARHYIGTNLPPLPHSPGRRSLHSPNRNQPFGQPGKAAKPFATDPWAHMSARRAPFGGTNTDPWGHPVARTPTLASSGTAMLPFKTQMAKRIDGELPGLPPMTGVTTAHYSRNQQLYLDDFKEATASKLMHPFVNTTVCGNLIDSSPHNLITGSNFAAAIVANNGKSLWQSESSLAYTSKSYLNARHESSSGLRCEQTIVGRSHPPVHPRTRRFLTCALRLRQYDAKYVN